MANTAMTVGVAIAASQADQETGTSTTTVVTPGRQHFHQCAAKFWVRYTSITSTAITSSYNVTSVGDNGTGNTTVTIATDFSGTTYSVVATAAATGNNASSCMVFTSTNASTWAYEAPSAGAFQIQSMNPNGPSTLDNIVCAVGYGDQ